MQIKPKLPGISGLWARAAGSRTENLRHAMLAAITAAGIGQRHIHLVGRIRHADDIDALWHTRSDMMTALAAELGEAQARAQLDALSGLFESLLPKGLRSRPMRGR